MRFLIFGAGAIGIYIGGSLALAGQEVLFLERPEAARALRDRGMCLWKGGKELRIESPKIVTSIEDAVNREADGFDAAILAVKSYDTQAVLQAMQPLARWMPPIIDLQNGVENEAALAQILGEDRVIAGSVTTAVGRKGVGEVVVERSRGVGLAATHPLSPALQIVFNQAGLKTRLFKHPPAMKWSKLLTNLIANASSAILDMSPGEIFSDPKLYGIEITQLRETLQVMSAQGIPVVDLPGTPVRLLAAAVQFLPISLSQPVLKKAVGAGRGRKMPSFHIDLYQGHGKSEVEYLNGAVTRLGEQLHIPTPTNRILTETLVALVTGSLPVTKYAHRVSAYLELFEPHLL